MNYFGKYVIFIILIKFLFIILSVSHLFLKVTGKVDSEKDKIIMHWRERVEFVFVFLMAIMLIYLFNPRANRDSNLEFETKFLLYLFGFILLITAKWNIFITESPVFQKIQQVVR